MENKINPPRKKESRTIKFMILLGIFSILNFLFFFFREEHRVNSYLFGLLAIVILYGVLKKLYMWYNYSNISVPSTPEEKPELAVDVFTTYFPGEPYDMITNTLLAIKNIRYPHTTYLCDEADDPYLKSFCKEHGIQHVTRNNRKDAKAGNINNALEKFASGEICVILDPDHIPQPDFLDPILPHFANPEIGFVQIVQSYYNTGESLVAQGAAEQTFQFYGPMMMTLNAYGAVNAIGANCVFRRAALDSIGGHAPGLCEDMHTAMLLYSKGWKAVYVPRILAKGLAPSTLTNYFKQQLKWSRGTFDLWVKVYPGVFWKLTNRQKIHYGILPMHYLSGLTILFTFLIPILSLLFSTTPWKGNIVDFALVLLPVAASAVLIRTFIQKWVIQRKERGFHLVGGLLHINTWWIYILGLVYTLLDKKVPYLPTPKEDDFDTNLKIVLPNAIVAAISVIAVVYGLYQDFTPFSIIMAGFALFNAGIMLFGIYIAVRLTNQNKILRTHLHNVLIRGLRNLKSGFYKVANGAFVLTRAIALPLLLIVLVTAMSFKMENDQSKWESIYAPMSDQATGKYLGIFAPSRGDGLSDMEKITRIEEQAGVDFNVVSFYLAWNDQSIQDFPHELVNAIYEKDALPMITWEPWASTLQANDAVQELQKEQKVFEHILQGRFDSYIQKFAQQLAAYDKPVFLRFAHEFDNPQYPWSQRGNNTSKAFRKAWKYVHDRVKQAGAYKVMFVWNPWKAATMHRYYPGDQYVDWIGITLLDYSPLQDIDEHSFSALYQPYEEALSEFTRKPVMLTEFGSLKKGPDQAQWLETVIDSIAVSQEEIAALVFFNSSLDKNFPKNSASRESPLDWTIDSWDFLGPYSEARQFPLPKPEKLNHKGPRHPITEKEIRGVRYKKGTNWKNNYYAVTREVLLKDIKRIKEAGINTMYVTGGNIYDHNLLLYSQKADLQLIYQFNLDLSGEVLGDRDKLKELEEELLDKVEDLKDHENIIGYSIPNNLEQYYVKPLLFAQRSVYYTWLQSLLTKIKDIDPNTPITMDLELNLDTRAKMENISRYLPIDSYGLIVNDETYLSELPRLRKETGHSYYISSITPEWVLKDKVPEGLDDLVLENWQDERHSNWMSFDGLIDFRNRKKELFQKIANQWTDKEQPLQQTETRILKPAEPLYPGQIYNYHATVLKEGKWELASRLNEKDYSYEWNLIKTDPFGNPLAVKKVGTGPELGLLIPENYKHYKLQLVSLKEGAEYTSATRTTLHTPTAGMED